MAVPVEAFVGRLTASYRVVVIGGLAVIAHGHGRHTQDADIWLEPMSSAEEWATAIEAVCGHFPDCEIRSLPGWREVSGQAAAVAAEEIGMLRICGLSVPLDIFRRPNEFDEADFEQVAARARKNGDGTFLPDALDLLQTKLDTNRDRDLGDIAHLEGLVRADYEKRLPLASLEEAGGLLSRFADWRVLRAALENPDQGVRDLATNHLREFAAAGDPFSLAILEGRETP